MNKSINWKTQKRKVSDLIPFPHNPRKITEKQKEDLKRSIQKFNLVEIPVINTDGTIIAGHQRLKILALLGRKDEEIDVRIPDRPLTDRELREYNLRSNKNTGEWDFGLLSDFEEDLLIEVGFDSLTLDKIKGEEKIEPEVEFTEELSEANNYVVLQFKNDIDWLQAQSILDLKPVQALDSKEGFRRTGVGRVVDGKEAIEKIKESAKKEI